MPSSSSTFCPPRRSCSGEQRDKKRDLVPQLALMTHLGRERRPGRRLDRPSSAYFRRRAFSLCMQKERKNRSTGVHDTFLVGVYEIRRTPEALVQFRSFSRRLRIASRFHSEKHLHFLFASLLGKAALLPCLSPQPFRSMRVRTGKALQSIFLSESFPR